MDGGGCENMGADAVVPVSVFRFLDVQAKVAAKKAAEESDDSDDDSEDEAEPMEVEVSSRFHIHPSFAFVCRGVFCFLGNDLIVMYERTNALCYHPPVRSLPAFRMCTKSRRGECIADERLCLCFQETSSKKRKADDSGATAKKVKNNDGEAASSEGDRKVFVQGLPWAATEDEVRSQLFFTLSLKAV
jgi:hypothetical protein